MIYFKQQKRLGPGQSLVVERSEIDVILLREAVGSELTRLVGVAPDSPGGQRVPHLEDLLAKLFHQQPTLSIKHGAEADALRNSLLSYQFCQGLGSPKQVSADQHKTFIELTFTWPNLQTR